MAAITKRTYEVVGAEGVGLKGEGARRAEGVSGTYSADIASLKGLCTIEGRHGMDAGPVKDDARTLSMSRVLDMSRVLSI